MIFQRDGTKKLMSGIAKDSNRTSYFDNCTLSVSYIVTTAKESKWLYMRCYNLDTKFERNKGMQWCF